LLFHHEPEHVDEDLDRLLDEARGYSTRRYPRLKVDAAVEGLTLNL
jgi:hypothetical protein